MHWTTGRRPSAHTTAEFSYPPADPVADDWHRFAALDTLTNNETRQQLSGVQAFVLTVGPLAGSSGAVRFSVVPWEPVIDLRNQIIDATAAVLEPTAIIATPRGLRPHVGIAYCNSPTDAHPIIKTLTALRELPRTRVTIDAVALVELRRKDRTYRWETVARLPLAGLPLAPPLH
ncbi:2'-5' RNA ligase family protein [Frankia sp. Cr2]|uniref:2'-5' RNA ligase family protein n=1 Tax=Frankia sp. Cr2 TaxID=3073932 RepID=UPI002AD291E2|nr:2'-5' RNA ligase family protein [Frankia sp. Cr2]